MNRDARQPSTTTWIVFAAGWLAVLAATLVRPERDHWFLTVFFALTLSLVWQRKFPWRRQGLLSSWIGPLFIVVWRLFVPAWSSAVLQRPDLSTLPTESAMLAAFARDIAVLLLIEGCGLAIVMAWLFRGYGIIPLFAMVVTLFPRRIRNAEKAAHEYPPRIWWVMPILAFALMGCVALLVISFVMFTFLFL